MTKVKYLVLGAGPCGLASAYQFSKLGIKDYLVVEKEDRVGGLCRTFKQGAFYFDNCTHILFTYRERIKQLIRDIGCKTTDYDRSAWVHAYGSMIHFPFQTSVAEFPTEKKVEVIKDIAKKRYTLHSAVMPKSYGEYLRTTFGEVMYQDFFLPYNMKLWQTDLYGIGLSWMKGRIPPLDLDILLKSLFEQNTKWGVNSKLAYPDEHGFGEITDKLYEAIEDKESHFRFNDSVVAIDPVENVVKLKSGEKISYEKIISTIPLPNILKMLDLEYSNMEYRHTKVVTTAIGFKGVGIPATSFQWCYFADKDVPFYRLFNVTSVMKQAEPNYWVYLFDHNFPEDHEFKEGELADLWNKDVEAAIAKGLMSKFDEVLEVQTRLSEHAYPIPTLERDEAMKRDHACLESLDIYSRGRFGYWKYECGNTDHSMLQGLEIVDRLVSGTKEETIYCGE